MEESRQAKKDSASPSKSSKTRSPAITGTRVASAPSTTSQPLEGDANVSKNLTRSFSTTTPTTSSTSTYEPTLRFPTPFGNHDLAEWISSSDPDIKSSSNSQNNMRVNEELAVDSVAVDGAGLSESTYELISGNTDSESQDGTYADSLMTESMESLDMLSRDDAASEHIVDEEEVYDDEPTTIDAAEQTPLPDDEDEDDDDVDEATLIEEATESAATLRPATNFAQQSLRTPTLGTPAVSPEVSRILSRDETAVMPRLSGLETLVHKLFKVYDEMQSQVDHLFAKDSEEQPYFSWKREDFERRTGRRQAMVDATGQPERRRLVKRVSLGVKYFFVMLVGLMPGLLLSTVWSFPFWAKQTSESPRSGIAFTATTWTTSTPNSVSATTTSNVKDLAAPEQEPGEMWFNKIMSPPPVVKFSSEGDDCVVVEVKPTIPKYWLGEDCVGIDSARDGDMVPNQWTATKHDTIKVKFSSQEAHGLIEVKLKAGCRPKFEKAVKVRFTKRGVLEKAVDRAKNLTQEVKALMVVAQEEAKNNLCAVQSSFGMVPAQIKDHTRTRVEEFTQWRQALAQSFRSAAGDMAKVKSMFNLSAWQNAPHEMVKELPVERAQMALLDYQIPAKVWWLRMTTGQAAAEEYKSKAKAYNALKVKEFMKGK